MFSPAYLCKVEGVLESPDTNNQDHWIIARSKEEAMKLATNKFQLPENKITLTQDSDVLDTWFSSGILPLSCLGWPNVEHEDFKAFFPLQLLETGNDILFFWVARMVMLSLTLHDKLPFQTVLLHNLVKDSQGKKMSKTKGNVIDPLEIINGCSQTTLLQRIKESHLVQKEKDRSLRLVKKEYPEGIPPNSSDSLRFSLLAYMAQGTNINLDIKRVIGYRHFCNKIWNAVKFALIYLPADFKPAPDCLKLKLSFIDRWILSSMASTIKTFTELFEDWKFGEATNCLYDFWLHKLCDIYLEAVKPAISSKNDAEAVMAAQNTLYKILLQSLLLTHPAMPFLTEELYQRLPAKELRPESICIHPFPKFEEEYYNSHYFTQLDLLMNVVQNTRSMLSTLNISNKYKPTFVIIPKIEIFIRELFTNFF